MSIEEIKTQVKEVYGRVAETGGFTGSRKNSSVPENMNRSMELGYSDQELVQSRPRQILELDAGIRLLWRQSKKATRLWT